MKEPEKFPQVGDGSSPRLGLGQIVETQDMGEIGVK